LANLFDQFSAIDPWQVQSRDHQIEMLTIQGGHRFGAIRHIGEPCEAQARQRVANVNPQGQAAVSDQDRKRTKISLRRSRQ